MMLLLRYFTREILTTVLAVAGVLFVLFLSHLCAGYFNQLSVGQLASAELLRLILLQTPLLLAIVLPLGLYLGILFAYGRLYADSEMTVSFASGMSRLRLVGITLGSSIIVLLIVSVVMLWLKPHLYWAQREVISDSLLNPFKSIAPGRFTLLNNGNVVLYTDHVDAKRDRLKNVFVAYRNQQTHKSTQPHRQIVTARSAYKHYDKKTQADFIVFKNGARYSGVPGQLAAKIVKYDEYGQRLPSSFADVTSLSEATRVKYLPTRLLWPMARKNRFAAAELQWRLAMPLSVILLALLAVPLSEVGPRKRRYAKLLPAILFYVAYMDMLLVSRAWIKKDLLSPAIGLWWVHGSMILIVVGFYFYNNWYYSPHVKSIP